MILNYVSYSEYSRSVTMNMKGSINMVKAPKGGQVWSHSFGSSVNKIVMYADDFRQGTIGVTVGTDKALGVVVLDKKIRALANSPRKALLGKMSEDIIDGVVNDSAQEMVTKAAYEAPAPALPVLTMESIR